MTQLVDLGDQVEAFLRDTPNGSATAHEISRHLFLVWSTEDIWCLARDNPSRFIVAEETDRHLPADLRVVTLVGGQTLESD